MIDLAYQASRALLRQASTESGFLASTTSVTNYRRIWARDGIICGLAGLLTGDAALAKTLKHTLITLAEQQTDLGHIPSNVYREGNTVKVSFGGLSGRVDTTAWFVIGVCNYATFSGDRAFAEQHEPAMRQCLRLMQAWEFNERDLLYVPQSGDWADEYILYGYVLYDQALRLWALRCFAGYFKDSRVADKARQVTERIQQNYWLEAEGVDWEKAYHPRAQQVFLDRFGPKPYWLSGFAPGGYNDKFDPLANALCVLLQLGTPVQNQWLLQHAQEVTATATTRLLPSFGPSIQPGGKGWDDLQSNYKYDFRNIPDEFHNGGVWPVWNGFWGAALCTLGELATAQQILTNIDTLNRMDTDLGQEWGFYENFHGTIGQPLGTRSCTWSAAGAVLLHQYLQGHKLYFG